MRTDLKIAILKSGRSQRQVSIETGVSETRISDFVRGFRQPREFERDSLMKLLGAGPELFAIDDTLPRVR